MDIDNMHATSKETKVTTAVAVAEVWPFCDATMLTTVDNKAIKAFDRPGLLQVSE